MFDWNLQELVPATGYDYRILLKQGSEESFRQTANGSFITQRKGPSTYTALLMTDPHTGYFRPGSSPVLTLDRVVQNASKVKADFVLDLGDNVAGRVQGIWQTNQGRAVSAYAQYRRQIGPLSAHCPHFALIGNWSAESGKFPEKEHSTRCLGAPKPAAGAQSPDLPARRQRRGRLLCVLLGRRSLHHAQHPDVFQTIRPGKVSHSDADVNKIEEWTLGQKQMSWFETTLKNATERYRFVCVHHPAGGNAGDTLNTLYGRGGSRAWNTGEQLRIHNLIKEAQSPNLLLWSRSRVRGRPRGRDSLHAAGKLRAPWHFTKEETGYERFWPESGHAQLDITPEKATSPFSTSTAKTSIAFPSRRSESLPSSSI